MTRLHKTYTWQIQFWREIALTYTWQLCGHFIRQCNAVDIDGLGEVGIWEEVLTDNL
jgi:hypothetical protein